MLRGIAEHRRASVQALQVKPERLSAAISQVCIDLALICRANMVSGEIYDINICYVPVSLNQGVLGELI